MWVCRGVGTLICISEGAKGSIDETFSTAICLTCVCFWALLTKCEGPGPPLAHPASYAYGVCTCVHVCVYVCVCVFCTCVCAPIADECCWLYSRIFIL